MELSTNAADPAAALLSGLNAAQRRAVTHDEGPLLVVAGPGTGKTRVITRRVAWLIATRRARPSEILALTFTDRAADEMQGRVDELVPYGYVDSLISTFHAFGDRLVREYALELGLPTDARVLARPEVVVFLREHLFELELDEYRPLGDPIRFLEALTSLFSRCKDEDISPEAYLAHAQALPATDETDVAERRRQLELAGAYCRYQELMARAGHVDFGDQVALALRMLRDHPAARREIGGRFRYILVDEFQDTNRAQWELVSLLASEHGNVMVVGDDDQAIYRFRGAALGNILGFRRRFPRARRIVLRRNYRSLAPILETSHRLIRLNDPERLEVRERISKRLVAHRRAPATAARGPAIAARAFGTSAEESDWVAAEIARRVAGGAAPRDHAVLVRSNAEADQVLRGLNLEGIPWRFSGVSGLYARPEVRELLSFLRAVADPSSTPDLYALAASQPYRLGGTDLTALLASARRTGRTLWDVLESGDGETGSLRLSSRGSAAVKRLVADVRRYAELSHQRPAGEVLYRFLKESGRLEALAETGTTAAEEALLNTARFFDLVRAQSALVPDARIPLLVPRLQTLIAAGDDPASAELDPDADAVAVLTAHKAKGLEFPVVFMVGLVEGRFPVTGRRDRLTPPDALLRDGPPAAADGADEERRLFYVGMTRARDELVLTYAADCGGHRTRRVSRFVLEALDVPRASVERPREPAPLARVMALDRSTPRGPSGAVPANGDPGRLGTGRGATRAGRRLSLSHYQVDDYLACPAKYRYVHVVGVPVAPHHSIVYGSALHGAVQEFHRRQMRGLPTDEAAVLDAFARAWTNEGFLSRDHEEARFAAGREALRRFLEVQAGPGAVVPVHVEREFSFDLEGDRVRGRWDRVDVEPSGSGVTTDRVTITDYKASDVRDPGKARERARASLQLSIYALAWHEIHGRAPDAVQLYFLDSGLVGRAEVDERRLEKARQAIRRAAAGIRAGGFAATPDRVTCSYCPFRDICPQSAGR
jgi:DNA helicase II / ATP-dependent DNA helicase PcrA